MKNLNLFLAIIKPVKMGNHFSKKRQPKRETVMETLITQMVQEVQHEEVAVESKELQTECCLEDKSLQTTFPPLVQKEVVETCIVSITLPNYVYTYEGLLNDAPHKKHGMSAEQWAGKADAALVNQRKNCEWVKKNTATRDHLVQLHINSRQNSPETIPVHWYKNPPPGLPCNPNCTILGPLPAWVYAAGNGRHQPRKCLPHCYYKYTNELQAHYKTCTTCKDPVV
jgi:hypothetical protein